MDVFFIPAQNVVFIAGMFLDWAVPDVPQSVQDEIRREKLLASRIGAEESVAEAAPPPSHVP